MQGDDKRWSYDRIGLSLATSPAVAIPAIIGHLPIGKTVGDLDQLLQRMPMAVPDVEGEREQTWSCRVRIREALRRIHAHRRYVVCDDVDAMDEEMWVKERE